MGVSVSKDAVDVNTLKRRNRAIDLELRKEFKANSKIIKLLLLGAAECGKSTILKQMREVFRILHNQGFNENEVRLQKSTIYGNILISMTTMIQFMQSFNIQFENPEREADSCLIRGMHKIADGQFVMPTEVVHALKRLWHDKGIQTVFIKGYEYQLGDSTKYFLDDIDRISTINYVPTEQDILRLRVATTGINEVEFSMKDTVYRVFDVGGQRSERRKWIHCFDNVNAVIFVAALSDYNMTLVEDNKMNRMHESIRLFETICNSKWFINTAMLIFLNKRDIFIDKIKSFPLKIAFPDYDGRDVYDESTAFIEKKFLISNKNPDKEIYIHKTCATDTKDMDFVFQACFDIICQLCLQRSGLV